MREVRVELVSIGAGGQLAGLIVRMLAEPEVASLTSLPFDPFATL